MIVLKMCFLLFFKHLLQQGNFNIYVYVEIVFVHEYLLWSNVCYIEFDTICQPTTPLCMARDSVVNMKPSMQYILTVYINH